MSYTVRYSDSEITTSKGFGRISGFPYIFDNRPGYHRSGSQYLIDCGLRLWSSVKGGSPQASLSLTPISLKNIAYRAANFLEWSEVRGVDLTLCDYKKDIVGRYQEDLMSGRWSRYGRSLANETVNLYVDEATSLVKWMSHKGIRREFEVPLMSGTYLKKGGRVPRHINYSVRKGRLRKKKADLRMPSDVQVKNWMKGVYENSGFTKALACETIMLSAVRKSELLGWRIDTLPLDPNEWDISNKNVIEEFQQVRISIKYGAKGPSYGVNHGDKVGPAGVIFIPLHLAKKINHYRTKIRPFEVAKWVEAGKTIEEQRGLLREAVHLFRDPNTGGRLLKSQLYAAWKNSVLPFKEWTVHMGRDWWACTTLLKEVKRTLELQAARVSPSLKLVAEMSQQPLELIVRPQLRHLSVETSARYLEWLAGMLNEGLPELYQNHLDELHLKPSSGERGNV